MKSKFANVNLDLKKQILYRHTPSPMAKSSFYYVQSVGHLFSAENYYTQREGYKSYLLIYTINGKGYVTFKGKKYELTKNQAMLIDCYEYHEYFTDKNDLWEIQWVHFYGSSSDSYIKLIYDQYGPVYTMSDNSFIPSSIDSILQCIEKEDLQFEIKASSIILEMLTEVFLTAPLSYGACAKKSQCTQVNAAIEFIEANYNTEITIIEMAKAACLSHYYFTRLFKRITGFSPYGYLIKYRINKAKTLLATTNQSIQEISDSVGFESESNFIRTFKIYEEVTPSKFRKLRL